MYNVCAAKVGQLIDQFKNSKETAMHTNVKECCYLCSLSLLYPDLEVKIVDRRKYFR